MYLPIRPFAIGVLLFAVVGIAGFNPENAPLDASDEHRLELETVDSNVLCDITFRGRHGGATDEITIDFRESQVRTRVGWWAAIARGRGEWGGDGPDPETVTLRPGDTFERDYSLTFGCNARRRYRFHITADGNEHTLTYPSEDEFTQQTLVDLGDVSRFFGWIEPGAGPVAGAPVEINGTSLEGEWVRIGNYYDPHDRMRIQVSGDQATLTYVPETADRGAWREGDLIWQGISSDGSLDVLGSNDRYYDARLAFDGSNRLDIDVLYNGVGNDQTWERSGGCWSEEYMADYGQSTPDIWVRFSTDLPAEAQNALRAARNAGAAIQTFAFTPAGEWVVVAADRPCYSSGFPSNVREWIDQYIESGREIDVVAFGPAGRWIVVAEDYLRRANNVSDEIMEDIRQAQALGRRITSFSFSTEPDNGWIFTAGGVAYWGDDVDVDVRMAVSAALQGQRPVHEISIAPDGSWVLVAEDWYASSGLSSSLLAQLDRYRTDEERRINHVVLHPDGTRNLWALISNEAEPVPDVTDLINLVEHGLPGDSSIYQRMKLHRITGLSIVLVQNNEVAWSRGYGLREIDLSESYVYPNTVFDAASISKSLTGAAVLQLVDSGDIALTEVGILMDLADDELPSTNSLRAIRADSIHLAHLMRHCAGIDNSKGVSGAEGFFMGAHLPTISEIFLGQAPAGQGNSIVKVDSVRVGEDNDYSGANSVLIQAIIEHYADGGYDGQMARLLDDLNMRNSTFRTGFWESMQRERFAWGHVTNAAKDIRIYPNQAAANLRTTASDLAQFVIMLNQDGMYNNQIILERTTVDQFVGRDGVGAPIGVAEGACLENVTMRLHIFGSNLGSTMNNELVYHGGLHNGYRTYMYSLPQREEGVVILITGQADDAKAFSSEVRNSLESAYGWPNLN